MNQPPTVISEEAKWCAIDINNMVDCWMSGLQEAKKVEEVIQLAIDKATEKLKEELRLEKAMPSQLLDVHAICEQRDNLQAQLDRSRNEFETLLKAVKMNHDTDPILGSGCELCDAIIHAETILKSQTK